MRFWLCPKTYGQNVLYWTFGLSKNMWLQCVQWNFLSVSLDLHQQINLCGCCCQLLLSHGCEQSCNNKQYYSYSFLVLWLSLVRRWTASIMSGWQLNSYSTFRSVMVSLSLDQSNRRNLKLYIYVLKTNKSFHI